MDAVVAAAVAAGADAIHPGYGFLSENPRLARACEAAGVVFIGPSAEVLEAAGDKLAAREHAVAAGLPVLPGGTGQRAMGLVPGRMVVGWRRRQACWPAPRTRPGWQSGSGIRCWSRRPGAAAGAGCGWSATRASWPGRSRWPARRRGRRSATRGCTWSGTSPAGRHVEVQLLGDGENVIHLGDRDCSVQRRYQKLIEEAPAPRLGETLRVGMRAAAVAFGQHLKYQGLGTVEFLVDAGRSEFWFLEVNARIQVEHPVTEAVTGLDLVAEQIAIAEGRRLRLSQASVRLDGHAIECRINAEDPAAGFRPSPGP